MKVRGGLDDALDKLARRDELRRRAAGEATGTAPAVTELVEAIAAVVGRNPQLGVTVGVESTGEPPMVLRFYVEDGTVQVTADNALAQAAANPRHADFDVEVGEPVEEQRYAAPNHSAPTHDDQDRYGPAGYGYESYPESDTAERRYGPLQGDEYDQSPVHDVRYAAPGHGETSRDLGARMRDLGLARSAPQQQQQQPEYPPHPYAATPPPEVPVVEEHAQTTRRIEHQQYQSPAEPPGATERMMPPPLAHPIPLQVERPEQTEMAARRLAALLRDDPSLLNNGPE